VLVYDVCCDIFGSVICITLIAITDYLLHHQDYAEDGSYKQEGMAGVDGLEEKISPAEDIAEGAEGEGAEGGEGAEDNEETPITKKSKKKKKSTFIESEAVEEDEEGNKVLDDSSEEEDGEGQNDYEYDDFTVPTGAVEEGDEPRKRRKKKKGKKRRADEEELEEDDIDLVRENTGQAIAMRKKQDSAAGQKKLKRLKQNKQDLYGNLHSRLFGDDGISSLLPLPLLLPHPPLLLLPHPPPLLPLLPLLPLVYFPLPYLPPFSFDTVVLT
jgi:Acidic N-terminal SPT6